MIVYFSSVTEFTKKFVEKLNLPAKRIPLNSKEAKLFLVDEPFILITPTYGAAGKGYVPWQVVSFLNQESNRNNLLGVIGSGNINFGEDFCKAAKIISNKCNVPLLYQFELSGLDKDVEIVNKGIKKFWETQQTIEN